MDAHHGNLHAHRTKTRNGADGYTAYGMVGGDHSDPYDNLKALFVAMFTNLTRGCSRSRVEDQVKDILREASSGDARSWAIRKLVYLAFQTRDARGGKGEKDLSRWILLALYPFVPGVIVALVPLIPEYGYWKDIPLMIADIIDTNNAKIMKPLLNALYDSMVASLQTDDRELSDWLSSGSSPTRKPKIGLVAKFIPKENRSYDRKYKVTKELAKRMYPTVWSTDFRTALRRFRKCVSRINKHLDTTEVKMSDKCFRDINFNRVPSKCLAKNRKAFLNKKMGPGRKEVDRHPDDPDRTQCRENLLSHMERVKKGDHTVKIHAQQLTPYDIVHSLVDVSSYSARMKMLGQDELDLIDLQFKDLRAKMIDQPATDEEKSDSLAQDGSMSKLRRTVPMIDVSGSMIGDGNGIPLKVAVGLGLTLSTLGEAPFSHRFLTFHSHPSWVEVHPDWSINRMVDTAIHAPWGGSTNLLGAFKMILTHAQTHDLAAEDMPDRLVIFTDMDFDQNGTSSSSWSTTYQKIEAMWSQAGYGCPPEVVFWNLNARSVAFPVKANTPGVRLISGWSIDLFKLFVSDDLDSYKAPQPWDTLEKALNSDRYHQINEILRKFDNGDGTFSDTAICCGDGAAATDSSPTNPIPTLYSSAEADANGWVSVGTVDYSSDPPSLPAQTKPSSVPPLPPPSLTRTISCGVEDQVDDKESKEDLRKQLLDLQKKQEEMMKLQQKLLQKLG